MANPRPDDASSSRRDFMRLALLGGLGTMLAPPAPALARLLRRAGEAARAQSIIHVFLEGGLSHIDGFDPKPQAPSEVRGPFGAVPTKLTGVRFSQMLSRTARVADQIAVIRSMTHGEAAHDRGVHNMLTGYRPSPAITYPSMGSVVAHELGSRHELPPYICLPDANRTFAGTGYLSSSYAPFSVAGEPNSRGFRVRDLTPPADVDDARQDRRRRLLAELDERFTSEVSDDRIDAIDSFYDQAWKLVESKAARQAFRIRAEPKKLRDRYGRTTVGQKLLLARRLVESGARYVTVFDRGYDHHKTLFRNLRRKLRAFDQGFAALIADLRERGRLGETLVLVTTEFGRTPRFNDTEGRDHWPKVFSVVLAGGGVKGGVVHGASNADGSEPDRDPVTPPDLAATIFHCLGVDHEKKLMSPGDRPIDIVRGGRVIKEILA